MNKIKVQYFDRIDVSEGINVSRTSASKEGDIWHYWYFLNKDFIFNQMSAMDAMIY